MPPVSERTQRGVSPWAGLGLGVAVLEAALRACDGGECGRVAGTVQVTGGPRWGGPVWEGGALRAKHPYGSGLGGSEVTLRAVNGRAGVLELGVTRHAPCPASEDFSGVEPGRGFLDKPEFRTVVLFTYTRICKRVHFPRLWRGLFPPSGPAPLPEDWMGQVEAAGGGPSWGPVGRHTNGPSMPLIVAWDSSCGWETGAGYAVWACGAAVASASAGCEERCTCSAVATARACVRTYAPARPPTVGAVALRASGCVRPGQAPPLHVLGVEVRGSGGAAGWEPGSPGHGGGSRLRGKPPSWR